MDSSHPLPRIDEEKEKDEDQEKEQEYMSILEQEIERLKTSAGLLHHRLNTMQDALAQETFQLDKLPIQVAGGSPNNSVRKLLAAMECVEDGLTVGIFLRALNTYLVQNNLVDLNTLQIIMTPLLCSAFHKAPTFKTYPYALLLTALPKMFQ
jgi:hypothetical protein